MHGTSSLLVAATCTQGERVIRLLRQSGSLQDAVTQQDHRFQIDRVSERLLHKDVSLWPADSVAHLRLGWLDAPEDTDVIDERHENLLLLGMGGSSLAPRVLANAMGVAERVVVLDDIAPQAIEAAQRASTDQLKLASTRVIVVSSKSGDTLETNLLFDYFFAVGAGSNIVEASAAWVAITDPGTNLERKAAARGASVYQAQPDIGGRFSALTAFGIVPMQLLGINTSPLRTSARSALQALRSPGSWPEQLASFLSVCEAQRINKVLLISDPSWAAMGEWLEQLISESLGKRGRGLLPVIATPQEAHRLDRADIVRVLLGHPEMVGEWDGPTITIEGDATADLGEAFLGWEAAIALCGGAMGIDPFNEPDVAAAKERTTQLLAGAQPHGADASSDAIADWEAGLKDAEQDGYAALLVFGSETPKIRTELQLYVSALRQRFNVPIILTHGPSYLHSMGQLFKGGFGESRQASTGGHFLVVRLPQAAHANAYLTRAEAILDAQAQGDRDILEERGRIALYCSDYTRLRSR